MDTAPFARLLDDVVIWEWDAAADRIVATPNLQDVYGVASLSGVSAGFSLLHAEDSEQHQLLVEQSVERNRGYSSAFRIVRPDNRETVWISERAEAIRSGGAEPTLLFGFALDVTAASADGKTRSIASRNALSALDRFVEGFLSAYASDIRQRPTPQKRELGRWVASASALLTAARRFDVTDLADVPTVLQRLAASRRYH